MCIQRSWTLLRDEARPGSSCPAQFDLHLSPGDVGSLICHCLVERGGIFGVFQRFEHPFVMLGTDNNCCALAATLTVDINKACISYLKFT